MAQTAHKKSAIAKLSTNSTVVAGLVAVAVVTIAGGLLHDHSFAATASYTHDPIGDIDYCALENNTTVLYGWIHDADAPAGPQPSAALKAGSQSQTVPSSLSGYRQTAVDNYIKAHYAGMPTSTVYGFRAAFGGLYKGSSYSVSGSGVNYGSGANAAIGVNTSSTVDGDKSKLIFAGNVIPDGCLATKPASPPPPPPPAPTPAPTPKPSPSPTPSPGPSPAPAASPAPSPAPSPVPSTPPGVLASTADATPSIGSQGASLKIPFGNAAKIHVAYGSDAANLDQSTPDIDTNGADTVVNLSGLKPNQVYSYQIVRTDSGGTVSTSPTASFTTAGLNATVRFVAKNKAVKNLKVSLSGIAMPQVSDAKGSVTFTGLQPGDYNMTYVYNAKESNRKLTVIAPAADPDAVTTISSSDFKVDVTTATLVSVKKSSSKAGLYALLAVLLLVGLAIVGFLLYRRGRPPADTYGDSYARPADVPEPPMAPPVPPTVVPPATPPPLAGPLTPTPLPQPQRDSQPGAEHAGQSLRDMVIEAMAKEAKDRHDKQG